MALRIVSFLPSATEMVYALGLEDQLFGVSHECDYRGLRGKPVVLPSVLPIEPMSQRQIDVAVAAHPCTNSEQSMYTEPFKSGHHGDKRARKAHR